MNETITLRVKTIYQHWIDTQLITNQLPSNPYEIPDFLLSLTMNEDDLKIDSVLVNEYDGICLVLDEKQITLSDQQITECVLNAFELLNETQYNTLINTENHQVTLLEDIILDRQYLVDQIVLMKFRGN